ncbi:amino acid ABC transporter substrate-binding protein [Enterococcus sp. MJM12]|uniref:Amino acid ABC transporter substrate-binding protein n=1 Tax=Candidatus Enterococcus myersii TaxID=2815322 RepID=A0ABS3H3L8_9ENTE|nr:amino acid ABC transporter substrate-binding protein [Enterococcus sp. MJM12]MBO0448055.1 amino acid ABC transporter substrate-binding protein [Enterococcus sp. MJM12]
MKLKKWSALLTVVASLGLLAACASKEENPKTKANEVPKEVVMGLDDTFVPMGFKDKKGNLVGFDIDLAKAVFKETGQKVKFQSIDWSMKETELDNGTIDVIWNGYSKTAEREKKVLFSDTYMENDQVLVTPKKSKLTAFKDMKGKILGAQEGSSGYDLFTKQPEVLKDIVADNDAVLYASFNEAFIDLENGRIDGLLIDKVYADYYLTQKKQMDDYNIIKGPFENEDYAIGVRKNDQALVEKINTALKTLKDNGEFKKISEKWFGEDVAPK